MEKMNNKYLYLLLDMIPKKKLTEVVLVLVGD